MLNNENCYLFKFAWKSIRRNTGRSFFISFSVSLAVVTAIWVVAFFAGLNTQIEDAVIKTNVGFFQLQEPRFSQTTDSSSPLLWTPKLEQKLSQYPVTNASPELVLDGNISTPEGAAGLTVVGIVPQVHSRYMPIEKNLIAGKALISEDSDSVIIGKELADIFKYKVGDQLVLNYQDVEGELRSELLTIKGIYHYNSAIFEKKFVYINQAGWQKLFLNADSGKILFNRIVLMTPGLKYEAQLRDTFKDQGLILKSWKDLNPEMAVVLDFHDGMINFYIIIIGVAITITILTPVRMLWQERLKELKMLTILGVSAQKLWKIGSFELLQMIFMSMILSSFFLITIIGAQSYTGIDFRYLNDGIAIERAGIKMPAVIYPQLSLEQLIITFLFVVFVLGISYLWSIHLTLRKLKEEV